MNRVSTPCPWLLLVLGLLLVATVAQRSELLISHGGFNPELRASDLGHFVSMAENLPRGLGYMDPQRVAAFNANPSAYRAGGPSPRSRLVWYSFNDPGLSFFLWIAVHVFGNTATPPLLLLWLQIAAEGLNVLLVFFVGRRLLGVPFGLACALLYTGYQPVAELAATHPYYFFWTEAMALWNLAFLQVWLGADVPRWTLRRRLAAAAGYGAFLGFASLVRPTFLPLSGLAVVLMVMRWRRDLRSVAPVVAMLLLAQMLVLSPISWRSYRQFGQLRPPRPMWHMMYIGMGAHPNPYGIHWDDQAGFDFARARGLRQDAKNWTAQYEAIIRDEVLRIRRESPWLWPRNTGVNLYNGLTMAFSDGRMRWGSGGRALSFHLPVERAIILVLVLGQAVCFPWLLRDSRKRWLYAAILLQGLYFVGGISAVIPPFFNYNTAYVPEFICFLAFAAWCLGGAIAASARGIAAWRPPAAEWPLPPWMLVLGTLGAAVLCWSGLAVDFGGGFLARLACALTVPVGAFLLSDLIADRWGQEAAAVAVRLYLGLGALTLLTGGEGLSGLSATLLNPMVLPQSTVGLLGIWVALRRSGLWAAALSVFLTGLHAEVVLMPLTWLLLLDAEFWRERMTPREALAIGWAAAALAGGVVAWGHAAGWQIPVGIAILPLACCVLISTVWIAGAPGRAVRALVLLVLLCVRFSALKAWPPLGFVLLSAWLVAKSGAPSARSAAALPRLAPALPPQENGP